MCSRSGEVRAAKGQGDVGEASHWRPKHPSRGSDGKLDRRLKEVCRAKMSVDGVRSDSRNSCALWDCFLVIARASAHWVLPRRISMCLCRATRGVNEKGRPRSVGRTAAERGAKGSLGARNLGKTGQNDGVHTIAVRPFHVKGRAVWALEPRVPRACCY